MAHLAPIFARPRESKNVKAPAAVEARHRTGNRGQRDRDAVRTHCHPGHADEPQKGAMGAAAIRSSDRDAPYICDPPRFNPYSKGLLGGQQPIGGRQHEPAAGDQRRPVPSGDVDGIIVVAIAVSAGIDFSGERPAFLNDDVPAQPVDLLQIGRRAHDSKAQRYCPDHPLREPVDPGNTSGVVSLRDRHTMFSIGKGPDLQLW